MPSNNKDLSFPFHYPISQTALLLLDFQQFTIDLCKEDGKAALSKAASLRDWALREDLLVVHSVVDVDGTPPPQLKGAKRVQNMLDGIKKDIGSTTEPLSTEPGSSEREITVKKQPGIVSGLKSRGCTEVLEKNDIKSLLICGLSTSGAVLRTAVPATDDGYVVTVISDACADRTRALHETLLQDVLPSRAHVLTVDELVQQMTQTKSAN